MMNNVSLIIPTQETSAIRSIPSLPYTSYLLRMTTVVNVFYHNNRYIVQTSLLLIISMFFTACNNNTDNSINDPRNTIAAAAPNINYTIVNIFPHDTAAFTEGLVWYNNQLFESTGETGYSNIRKVDLKTGAVQQKVDIDKKLFGEGITIMNDKIYQITWQSKIGFVYDVKTMHQTQSFTIDTEGWGITNDGKQLIISDGSSNVYFLDPHTFQKIKIITVSDNNGPVNNINELELVKGYIYANRWQTNDILKIDTASGRVIGKLVLPDLLDKYAKSYDHTRIESLNGIAYDSAANRIFITGKRWPLLFEIKMD